MSQQLRTQQQQAVVNRLVQAFGIDGSKVLFLNEKNLVEPWLRGKTLAAIARKSGLFKVIRVEVEQPILALKQVVYQGTVVDLEDRSYSLPGVATLGEKIAETDEEVNENDLAESRALRSTLELAGFDPLDPMSVVPLDGSSASNAPARTPEAASTNVYQDDMARIHILGREKGLIVGKDYSKYRKFLVENYDGAVSVAGFDALQRKSVIAALELYRPEVPDEFAGLDEEHIN
jgi:hypothetical protein